MMTILLGSYTDETHPDGRTAFLVSELGNLLSLLRLTPLDREERFA